MVGSYTPLGSVALLLRMIRLFRVLKLLKVLPQLRMLLMALTSAFSSIFYTCTLMLIFFYVMAIMCIIVFRSNDPFHWKNLHVAIMSLFRIATGDDWTDVMYINMYGSNAYGYSDTDISEWNPTPSASPLGAAVFFVSFGLKKLIPSLV